MAFAGLLLPQHNVEQFVNTLNANIHLDNISALPKPVRLKCFRGRTWWEDVYWGRQRSALNTAWPCVPLIHNAAPTLLTGWCGSKPPKEFCCLSIHDDILKCSVACVPNCSKDNGCDLKRKSKTVFKDEPKVTTGFPERFCQLDNCMYLKTFFFFLKTKFRGAEWIFRLCWGFISWPCGVVHMSQSENWKYWPREVSEDCAIGLHASQMYSLDCYQQVGSKRPEKACCWKERTSSLRKWQTHRAARRPVLTMKNASFTSLQQRALRRGKLSWI